MIDHLEKAPRARIGRAPAADASPARAAGGSPFNVKVVRSLDGLLRVQAVRALVFVGDQRCPYSEEFDGNDFAGATHLLALQGSEPIGVGRIRWFADFAKLERIAVRSEFQGLGVCKALWETAHEIAGQKGYTRMLAHVEAELVGMWTAVAGARPRTHRPAVCFSDREYVEIVYPIHRPADALSIDSDALLLVRPEGAWRTPGVLDASSKRRSAGARKARGPTRAL